MQNKNEEHISQLTKIVLQNSLLKSSTSVGQPSDQVGNVGTNLDVPAKPTSSPDKYSSCVSATLTTLEMENLIVNCDLKSEEITSLMGETVPSSDSDDNYGSGAALKSDCQDVQLSSADIVKNLAEMMGKDSYKGFMRSWLADGSNDSVMSFCREPLIPPEDESDMEEFGNEIENLKCDAKVSDEKGEPFVEDLINLKESQEKILESSPNQTVVANVSLFDIENESEHNQTTAIAKSHVDIETETNQTSKKNKSLLSLGNESIKIQAAESKKSLLDIEIALNQKDMAKKSLLDTEFVTANQTETVKESLLGTEIVRVANQTVVSNKSPLDGKVATADNQTAVKNSLLDTKIETAVNQTAVKNSLLDTKIETAVNQTAVSKNSFLDSEITSTVTLTDFVKKSLLDTEDETTVNQKFLAKKSVLDADIETVSNQTAVVKNSVLDAEIETANNQTAVANNSCLDSEIKAVANLLDLAKKSLLDTEVEASVNQTAVTNKNFLDTEIVTEADLTAMAKKSLMDTDIETAVSNNSPRNIETETGQNQTATTKKSFPDVETEETLLEEKQISNSETDRCARVCVEHIKGVLTNVLTEVKTPDQEKDATNIYLGSGSYLETLEEQLRAEAEANSLKNRQPHVDYEIGFPQKSIHASLRVIKDESFKRKINKIWVCDHNRETFLNELSDENELKEGSDEIHQTDETDAESKEKFEDTDCNEYVDVVSIEEAPSINDTEGDALDTMNVIAPEVEPQNSAEPNIIHEFPIEQNTTGETTEINESEKSVEAKVETEDAVKDQKTETVKSILKKRVTFSEKKGDLGMEHMALHQEDSPKIEETRLEMDTPLRFLTETYPSHDDEELLSESLNATLEPNALSWPRMEPPRFAGSHEKQKIHEGDETQTVSPCQSPERSDNKDDKTTGGNSGNKFSKFIKSVKKKIFS